MPAGLLGRFESWLSPVERGILMVDSHEILTRLARVLHLDPAELTGAEPEAVTDMRYDAVRAIEGAIVAEIGREPRTDPVSLLAQAQHTYAA
ncbi:helix-turn-helix domain-containing protein [Nocardiopsis sp. MT53]|uniref:helix-turn-helix domain-containing protein n=1 Tax=Nocardiopsis sp. MT53 TaxID=2865672 RepID=UPI0021023BA6|nr:helix-turn-helix domain-containing protein [Nocardiopsis sp. MT53]